VLGEIQVSEGVEKTDFLILLRGNRVSEVKWQW